MSLTTVHFENQREIISQQINNSKVSIIIAVAWFTDEILFNLLLKKAGEGIKIKVIIHDDEINSNSKINFEVLNTINGEFIRVSNENQIMHHKFCVIDCYSVLHGSYNWTYNAQKNNEALTLTIGDIQLAAKFILEFFKIKNLDKKNTSILNPTNLSSSENNFENKKGKNKLSDIYKKIKFAKNEETRPDKYQLILEGDTSEKIKTLFKFTQVFHDSESLMSLSKKSDFERFIEEINQIQSNILRLKKLTSGLYFRIILREIIINVSEKELTDKYATSNNRLKEILNELKNLKASCEKIIAPAPLQILLYSGRLKESVNEHIKYIELILSEEFTLFK
jgi:DNA polymerase III delta prime subunit